jgi:peptide/nickel transport system ATP-binding protein
MAALLEVKNLKTQFKTDAGLVTAVDGVSYHVDEHEIIGVVGESGCGKSVTQLSGLQLIPNPPGRIFGGEVWFEERNLLAYAPNGPEMRSIRGSKISMIFQEPMTSLNPVLSVNQQLSGAMQLHLGLNKADAKARAIELLKMVGIPAAEGRVDDYPHQFSGGMRQRVMIAMALSCHPKLIIADEPTTALDVTTQAVLLELMKDIVDRFNTSLVLVTHNLGVVARYAQRIYVMYAGRVVETGTTKDIFAHPRHPYTVGLLKSVPRLDQARDIKLVPIEGLPPNLVKMPPTCAFLPRCPYAIERCQRQHWPSLTPVGDRHLAACFVHLDEKVLEIDEGKHSIRCEASELGYEGTAGKSTLLDVKHLKMYFPVTRGLLAKKVAEVKAVDDVSFKVNVGETLGLVGESGCGKTTVGRGILRLVEPTSGEVFFEGQNILKLSSGETRKLRRKMSLMFQDPYGSLNPRQSAGSIVGEPLIVHQMVKSKAEYHDRIEQLFRQVGLDAAMADRVPHEFSGGQRQRIGIARALACEPSLIVCDEPISALDVSIQAQIINLLRELQEGMKGLTYLFIAHDLSVVRHISDRIAVMYLGHIVEVADSDTLYRNPLHPYTRALLSAVPIADPFVEENRERILLKGEVPSPLNPPSGCPFNTRCSEAICECSNITPQLNDVGNSHEVACIRA